MIVTTPSRHLIQITHYPYDPETSLYMAAIRAANDAGERLTTSRPGQATHLTTATTEAWVTGDAIMIHGHTQTSLDILGWLQTWGGAP